MEPRASRSLNSEAGFTLVELLVVVIVVAILMTVALPSFLGQSAQAHDSAAKQYLATAYHAAAAAAVFNTPQGSFVPAAPTSADFTALAAAINKAEPELDAVPGACPTDATSDLRHIVIDTAGTHGTSLKLCNDPSFEASQRVWILTVSQGSSPAISSVAVGGDGTMLYTGFDTAGTQHIYAVNADGGTPAQLADQAGASSPQSSPDGTQVAYVGSDPASGRRQIYVEPAGGGSPTQLTSSTNGDASDPAWSPDGKTIAYAGWCAQGGNSCLFTVPAAGGTPTQLAAPPYAYVSSPAWSPDGKTIAYAAPDSTWAYRLYVIPAGGGTPTSLVVTGSYAPMPSWSPDGKTIAYSWLDSSGVAHLSMVPAGGGARTDLASGNQETVPAWSPDGSTIAYPAQGHLYTIPAVGGAPSEIATTPTISVWDGPAWSPDGSKLALVGNASNGIAHLYSVPPNGGAATELTANAYAGDPPVWTP